jgi:hypothetical protein
MKENLKPGDRVLLYHMEDEVMGVGVRGTVERVSFDPFEDDNLIFKVNWDNGSTLSLLSKYDYYKKINDSSINESMDDPMKKFNFLKDNRNFLKNFDNITIQNFLKDLKDSGVTNMLNAGPYLYSGEKWILNRHGSPYDNESMEENEIEAYERVLANAETIKNKIIDGVYKNIHGQGLDLDISGFNIEIRKQINRLLNFYMLFA